MAASKNTNRENNLTDGSEDLSAVLEFALDNSKYDETKKIQLHFSTTSDEKAWDLAKMLQGFHEYELIDLAEGKDAWLIVARTEPLLLSIDEFLGWQDTMADLASRFNADFDGWKTMP